MVGRPGAGKTTLVGALLSFASRGSVAAAPATGAGAGEVAGWPGVRLALRRGRARGEVLLVDTPGFSDAVDPDSSRRRWQAAAMEKLLAGVAVLHVVDAASLGQIGPGGLAEVDRDLAALRDGAGPYALVAAKADLPWALAGLLIIRQELPGVVSLPVSARTGAGLRQVQAFCSALLGRPGTGRLAPGRR